MMNLRKNTAIRSIITQFLLLTPTTSYVITINDERTYKIQKGDAFIMENSMEQNITGLNDWIKESDNIVFFGGAGVSSESGIPDFRSVDGLYHQKYDYPPETILSHSFYMKHTEEFYKFYRDKMLCLDKEPNAAHKKLAEWENKGKLKAIVTQNIDGLHQAAGSKNVLELHGSVHRNYCTKCHKFFDAEYVKAQQGVPKCDDCGGIIKPDVVLYEEGLNEDTLESAVNYISKADILIIGGTSLVVYPAAGLIDYYRGHKLVLVNKSSTSRDGQADLIISGPIGEVFSKLD